MAAFHLAQGVRQSTCRKRSHRHGGAGGGRRVSMTAARSRSASAPIWSVSASAGIFRWCARSAAAGSASHDRASRWRATWRLARSSSWWDRAAPAGHHRPGDAVRGSSADRVSAPDRERPPSAAEDTTVLRPRSSTPPLGGRTLVGSPWSRDTRSPPDQGRLSRQQGGQLDVSGPRDQFRRARRRVTRYCVTGPEHLAWRASPSAAGRAAAATGRSAWIGANLPLRRLRARHRDRERRRPA